MSSGRDELMRVMQRAEMVHDRASVAAALDRLAREITDAVGTQDPILLTVMTGALIPAAWLSTRLQFPHRLDYCHATRYRGATRGGDLAWLARPRLDLDDQCVLVIDDILDEGHTLHAIRDYCRDRGAGQVLLAVLVRKRHDRCRPDVHADFVGLEVPDRYVFGCGMDYQEHFRNLDAIYALPDRD
jgi:hypoxanthine phosphoribosyltransferase